MADDSTDSLVTPEKIEVDGENISKSSAGNSGSLSNGHQTRPNHRRASIGSPYHAGDSSTRNSTEKSDSANSSQNAVPHYLRASTGSCHDFCKYGKKHSSEEKPWKPLRRRIKKPLLNEHPVLIIVSGEQKKDKVVNPTDTNNHSPELKLSPDTKSYSPKPKTSSDKKKVIKNKPSTDTKNLSPDLPPSDKKTYYRKPKTSSDAKTYSPKQNASSGNKAVLPKSKKPSSSKKFPLPDPPEIVKSVYFPSKKGEEPVKQGSSTDTKMSGAEKKTTYLSKQRYSPVKSKPVKIKPSFSSDNSDGIHSSPVKSKPVKIKPSFSSDNSDGIRSSPVKSKPVKVKPSSSSGYSDGLRGKGRRTNSESETGRHMTASKASTKKVLALAPSAATFPPKVSVIKIAYNNNSRKGGNLKLVSHPKDRNRMRRVKTKASNNEKVSEKILHVIKTGIENNVFESTPNEPSSPKSPSHEKSSSFSSHEEENEKTEYSNGETDEFISGKNESLEISKAPPVKQNHNKTPRKTKVAVSEDKKCSPAVKLKFRNGKVVDLQSNNNSPRRLRFRKARVLGPEEGKGDLRRRIFKKGAFNDNATGSEVSSEKVVLKHQDVQDKKDAQGLFNNVIEETASKLVESRKSKVKALVGAFETVISLQESKPSLQAVG